jgi:hypothetical protein
MKDTIKSITIYPQVLSILENSAKDKLGVIISFELFMYPNETISAARCLDWFKHILSISGYVYEHIKELGFDEMAECWVTTSTDYSKVYVGHKYWSYKTTKLIFELLRTYAVNNEIPFKEEYR